MFIAYSCVNDTNQVIIFLHRVAFIDREKLMLLKP